MQFHSVRIHTLLDLSVKFHWPPSALVPLKVQVEKLRKGYLKYTGIDHKLILLRRGVFMNTITKKETTVVLRPFSLLTQELAGGSTQQPKINYGLVIDTNHALKLYCLLY